MSLIRTTSARVDAPEQELTRSHLGRSLPESADSAGAAYQHDEFTFDGDESFGPQSPTTSGHTRRLTDPGARALRTRLSRVSEAREERGDDSMPAPGEGNYSNSGQAGNRGMRTRVIYTQEPAESRGSEKLEEGSEQLGESSEPESIRGNRRLPPSYHTAPSGSARRSYISK